MEPLSALMIGTTAVIWSNEIPQTPAQIALKWAKDEPKFVIKDGYTRASSSMPPASTRSRRCPARTRSAPRC